MALQLGATLTRKIEIESPKDLWVGETTETLIGQEIRGILNKRKKTGSY
ncbi:hypothetical protein J2Z40_002160 [Cytobacillus eiseniae]|uniref:Uncharacterized protein n=1 Tax=Cytobacillus eiseniae TaxID=762947 RepID=A0ABS4RFC1_9BACI|nr:hypothetical protein [Cytobacillus eiseniae]MBP2241597.1 hypothetical protein [Cytobacillus eiseniae]